MKPFHLLIMGLICHCAFTQSNFYPDAQSIASGQALISEENAFAFFNLAAIETNSTSKTVLGINYNAPYFSSAFQQNTIGFLHKIGTNYFTGGIQSTGYQLNQNIHYGLGYGLNIHPHLILAIALSDLAILQAKDYRNYHIPAIDLSFNYRFNSKIRILSTIQGINKTNTIFGNRLIFRTTLSYEITQTIKLYLTIFKNQICMPYLSCGIRYSHHQKWQILGSYSSNNQTFSFGINTHFKKIELTFSTGIKSKSGIFSSINLSYSI